MSGPEGTWTTDVIPAGGTYVQTVTAEMALSFSGTAGDGADMFGELSYGEAPLN